VLASALKEMMVNETITEAPKDCDDSGVFWETGKKLFHYLKSRNINGKTGRVVLITNFILFSASLLNSLKS
jgi:glutamate receptor ionotropic, NMDA 1